MEESGNPLSKPVQRLCSEIQLFDLCDLDECGNKEGRFCTDKEMLDRFERIEEVDDRRPREFFTGEEFDESECDDEQAYDGDFTDVEYDDEVDSLDE